MHSVTEHQTTPMADTDAAPTSPAAGKAPADVAFPKTIRSYVRRTGRVTTGQAKAFEDIGP
ncbi:MAG: tRNA (guanosine(46)-N7)-methyltransferase TrmB, partial [Comamonas sp.]